MMAWFFPMFETKIRFIMKLANGDLKVEQDLLAAFLARDNSFTPRDTASLLVSVWNLNFCLKIDVIFLPSVTVAGFPYWIPLAPTDFRHCYNSGCCEAFWIGPCSPANRAGWQCCKVTVSRIWTSCSWNRLRHQDLWSLEEKVFRLRNSSP